MRFKWTLSLALSRPDFTSLIKPAILQLPLFPSLSSTCPPAALFAYFAWMRSLSRYAPVVHPRARALPGERFSSNLRDKMRLSANERASARARTLYSSKLLSNFSSVSSIFACSASAELVSLRPWSPFRIFILFGGKSAARPPPRPLSLWFYSSDMCCLLVFLPGVREDAALHTPFLCYASACGGARYGPLRSRILGLRWALIFFVISWRKHVILNGRV